MCSNSVVVPKTIPKTKALNKIYRAIFVPTHIYANELLVETPRMRLLVARLRWLGVAKQGHPEGQGKELRRKSVRNLK